MDCMVEIVTKMQSRSVGIQRKDNKVQKILLPLPSDEVYSLPGQAREEHLEELLYGAVRELERPTHGVSRGGDEELLVSDLIDAMFVYNLFIFNNFLLKMLEPTNINETVMFW